MSIPEIEEEIIKLESAETSWQNVQRLSWLYTVKDHLSGDKTPIIANKVISVMPEYNGEFGEVVSGVNIDNIMSVMNEHMEVIKILLPKEYQAVISKIKKPPE